MPDAAHEALRDLVRAREAAKKDQLRARHRLGKFLLRHGRQRPEEMKAWTQDTWMDQDSRSASTQPALEATLVDYLHEVEHVAGRIVKLEKAIDEAVGEAPAGNPGRNRSVASAARRGTDHGGDDRLGTRRSLSRFPESAATDGLQRARARANTPAGSASSAGAITKTGNAHLRRVLVEAAWAYQHRPKRWAVCCARAEDPGAQRRSQEDCLESATAPP